VRRETDIIIKYLKLTEMPILATVEFVGKSGTKYPFNIYPITEECPQEAGIYVFGNYKQVERKIDPVYIGKAVSFQARFIDHHKDPCIKANGDNTICLMQVKDESQRTTIEKDLLAAYPTKCNEVNNPITPR